MENVTIAVIMTVHNRRDTTLECMRNLYAQKELDRVVLDIYLTDDGSTDGTSEAVSKEFPKVNIKKGDGNLFWNRGMWTAWNEAATQDFDYYLWLNDDTYVFPTMISDLLSASFSKNDRAIIVGSTQDNKKQVITYGGYDRDNRIILPNGHLQLAHHFNGNVVLVPQYVYNIVGNLDEYFTHSNGDIDYGQRASKLGINSFIVGDYVGTCDRHKALDNWCNPSVPLKERLKILNRPNGMPLKEKFYLQKKHQGLFVALFHVLTICVRCLFPHIWVRWKRTQWN